MKFIGKIKKAINRKNNKKLSRVEALLEDETISSKYTRDEIVAGFKWHDAFERERKCRRREDRRDRFVNGIGIILGFVVINGSFITFVLLSGIEGFLRSDKLWLGTTLTGLIFMVIWFGYVYVFALTFFWLSDKTGFHYLIEDWVVSWETWDAQQSHNIQKYKSFPRRKKRVLIRDLKKELDEITDQLYRLEWEADEAEDEKLSDSVESLNQVIGTLDREADISSRNLIYQPEHASWKGFVLALEETSNELELELKDIDKYHKNIKPLLKHASDITSKALYSIINSGNDKGKAAIIID